MSRVQQVLKTLLIEIDELCNENGWTYFLGGETAYCASRHERFSEGCHAAVVFMPEQDYDSFEELISKKPGENRAIESLATNKKFSETSMHYVDTMTTQLNIASFPFIQNPGIHVRICKLVPVGNGRWEKLKLALKQGLAAIQRQQNYGSLTRGIKSKLLTRVYLLFHPINGKSKIYRMKLHREDSKVMRVYVQSYFRKRLFLSLEVTEGVQWIEFEGHSFSVPQNYQAYIAAQFGKRWLRQDRNFATKDINIIMDAERSYSSYYQVMHEYEEQASALRKARKPLSFTSAKRQKLGRAVIVQHRYYERALDRENCEERYLSIKPQLMNHYKDANFFVLAKMMDEYQLLAEKYANSEIPFAFDKDLYIVMLDILNWQHLVKYRRILRKQQPEAFMYLDSKNPENEQLLDDSLYEYNVRGRYFTRKISGEKIPGISSDEKVELMSEDADGEFLEEDSSFETEDSKPKIVDE